MGRSLIKHVMVYSNHIEVGFRWFLRFCTLGFLGGSRGCVPWVIFFVKHACDECHRNFNLLTWGRPDDPNITRVLDGIWVAHTYQI